MAGASAVDGADGGGGVPGVAVGPRSWRRPASSRAATAGRCRSSRACQGCSGSGTVSVGQSETGTGEACGELLGRDGAAALGPGGVGGEDGAVDGHPVQREGATQLG